MSLTLRPADVDMLDAAMEGDEALSRVLGGIAVAEGWAVFTQALPAARRLLAADGPRWRTRLFLHDDTLVGWGGFKGPPVDGVVELGYSIAPAFRGRGLATAATEAMLAEAWADDAVHTVVAHTLAERNASTRVLEKAGFAHDGEAEEGGERVWRWVTARASAAGGTAAPPRS